MPSATTIALDPDDTSPITSPETTNTNNWLIPLTVFIGVAFILVCVLIIAFKRERKEAEEFEADARAITAGDATITVDPVETFMGQAYHGPDGSMLGYILPDGGMVTAEGATMYGTDGEVLHVNDLI